MINSEQNIQKLKTLNYYLIGISTIFFIILFILYSQIGFENLAEIYLGQTEEYRPSDIVVNANSDTGFVLAPWTGLAQGGEEMQINMLAGTENSIKKLEPSYVRLDHIFDDDYYGVYQNGQYNWTKLDQVVNSILAMGAKPFFSLGYMPSSLASSKIDIPTDWNKWSSLVLALINRYSGKSSKNIDNIYYEVWNEPDLESFGKWHYGSSKNYLTLYSYSATAAKSARDSGKVNQFKFGGPATTALYKNWIIALTEYCTENKLPLDFISWHRYSYNPEIFNQDINDVYNWLGKDQNYELVISEWGPDSYKTSAYASNLAAAHAIAVIRKTIQGINWLYAFEIKDGPDQGLEGWGLLGHNKASFWKKPRYKAMNLITDMSGTRLDLTGEGSNIYSWSVKNSNSINLIASNYGYQNPRSENLPIKFINLETGEYQLSWQTLSGKSGEEFYTVDLEFPDLQQNFNLDTNDILKINLTQISQINFPEIEKLEDLNSFSQLMN